MTEQVKCIDCRYSGYYQARNPKSELDKIEYQKCWVDCNQMEYNTALKMRLPKLEYCVLKNENGECPDFKERATLKNRKARRPWWKFWG
jgi:hypothetical protein